MLLLADAYLLKVDNKARLEPPVQIQTCVRVVATAHWKSRAHSRASPSVTHDFLLSVVVKLQHTPGYLPEVVAWVPASQVQTQFGVGQGVALVVGHSVGDSIPRIYNNASCVARGTQEQDSLAGRVHGPHVEGLKHNLSHLFTGGLGIQEGLDQQHQALLGGHMHKL